MQPHAKVFSILVLAVLLGYGAVGFYFLPMATFQGDLTRMGQVPERLFGWTKPQPAIEKKWLQQASWSEADVLVIGDSFSEGHVWQSRLTERGLRVRTETWNTVRAICADFVPWLRTRGFAGTLVVFESIERNVANDLRKSIQCQHMEYRPSRQIDMPPEPPPVSFDKDHGDHSGKLSVGIRTYLNMLAYERLSRSGALATWVLANNARMSQVPGGCGLFSHLSCNHALFLNQDQPGEVAASVLGDMSALEARMKGLMPIWVVVPNKSTVYLYPDKRLWDAAEQRFHAPNLLRMARQAVQNRTLDLYPANNTHFSTTGYLLMGDEIYQAISRMQGR